MADIVTCQLRIILKKHTMLTNLTDVMRFLLRHTRGISYGVSLQIQHTGRIIDIQYGSRNLAHVDIAELWWIFGSNHDIEGHKLIEQFLIREEFMLDEILPSETPIESIWLRQDHGYNEGFDDFFYAKSGSKQLSEAKPAIYQFEEVKILWQSAPSNILDIWQAAQSDNGQTWFSKEGGTYLSQNPRPESRNVSLHDISTLISPIYDIYEPPFFELDEMPNYIIELENDFLLNAETIEFFWQGRCVRKFEYCHHMESNDYWWAEYNLDYWDNSVNPEWLAYKQEIGLEE